MWRGSNSFDLDVLLSVHLLDVFPHLSPWKHAFASAFTSFRETCFCAKGVILSLITCTHIYKYAGTLENGILSLGAFLT